MTLNQVIRRIKGISLAHKQVRGFRQGLVSDWFADKTALYPGVCLQDSGGSISLGSHATTLNYRMFFADLVNVSADAKTNLDDVQSDMLSVAMDILAQMNFPSFDDWKISTDASLQLFDESENDLYAGCYIDISIRIMFSQNVCQVPSNGFSDNPTDTDMLMYDISYNAAAGLTSLTIDALKGKKIMLVVRENNVLYKASNQPGTTEYTWDGITIGLGTPVGPNGERFLILYRNY